MYIFDVADSYLHEHDGMIDCMNQRVFDLSCSFSNPIQPGSHHICAFIVCRILMLTWLLSQERHDTTRFDRLGREIRNESLLFGYGNYTANQEGTIIEAECCSAVANYLRFCCALSSILAHSRISIREREMGCKLVPSVSV